MDEVSPCGKDDARATVAGPHRPTAPTRGWQPIGFVVGVRLIRGAEKDCAIAVRAGGALENRSRNAGWALSQRRWPRHSSGHLITVDIARPNTAHLVGLPLMYDAQ
ncbi:hypothetical protein V493_01342 [Pseudogymnoascus sp. VKM F-4281 (FW-2241)]|nr:hypothetical protein V493_01342 [Pseudogymnoascus sp. VKM F-4281 (FW-2241)]